MNYATFFCLLMLLMGTTIAQTKTFPAASALPEQKSLPDPLVMFDGKPVMSKEQWVKQRRPELKALFQHYMYGYLPAAPKIKATIGKSFNDALGGKASIKEVTIDLAKHVVEKFVKNVKREISIDYIQKIVSDYFQLDLEILQSKTRKRHVVQARQLAMFFAKKFTKASLANIGSQIGDRDHATVLHACKTVDNLVATDKQFKKFVEDIHKKLSL